MLECTPLEQQLRVLVSFEEPACEVVGCVWVMKEMLSEKRLLLSHIGGFVLTTIVRLPPRLELPAFSLNRYRWWKPITITSRRK
jgi:hypothetical protein